MGALAFSDIKETHAYLLPYIHKTPLVYSNSLSEMFGAGISLKAENLQRTGLMKPGSRFINIDLFS